MLRSRHFVHSKRICSYHIRSFPSSFSRHRTYSSASSFLTSSTSRKQHLSFSTSSSFTSSSPSSSATSSPSSSVEYFPSLYPSPSPSPSPPSSSPSPPSPSPSSSSSASRAPPHLPQLLRWLEEHGGYAEFCVVSNDVGYEKGRGIFALTAMSEKSEAIIKVPAALAISISNITSRHISSNKNSNTSRALSWSDIINSFHKVQTSSHIFNATASLAMFLLYEQQLYKKSFYYQWIRYFPDVVGGALYFTQRELDELQGCTETIDLIYAQVEAFLKLDKARESLCAQFPDIFNPSIFSSDKFKWAFATILARSITDDDLPTLVPYFDFLNAATESRECNSDIMMNDEGDIYQLRANQTMMPGHEITTSYCGSDVGGSEMLCRYGFSAMSHNIYVRFRLRVPRDVLKKFEKNMRVWDIAQAQATYARNNNNNNVTSSTTTATTKKNDIEEIEMDEHLRVDEEKGEEDELPYVDLEEGRVEIPIDFYMVPAPLPVWILEILRALIIAKHKLDAYSPLEPLPYEHEIGVYEKLRDILFQRLDQYLTNTAEDIAILKAEDSKPSNLPHLRSFGDSTQDNLEHMEKKAREALNAPQTREQSDFSEEEVKAIEKQLLQETKSTSAGIEPRLYIHIVRLRMQEKLVLQHHLEGVEQELKSLEEQYERRMRILRRAPKSNSAPA